MIEFTENNWLKIGYQGQNFYSSWRNTIHDQFVIDFDPGNKPLKSFKYHCIEAAKKIFANYGRVNLAFSGGMDSEIMLLSFIESNADFYCTIMRYWDEKNGKLINFNDVNDANEILSSYGLTPYYHDIHIRKFALEPRASQMSKKFKLNSFITMAMASLIDASKFPVILGAGDPIFFRLTNDNQKGIFYIEGEYTMEWFRTFHGLKKKGIPGFFYYTPEIIRSFLASLQLRKYALGASSDLTSIQCKKDLYKRQWPSISYRKSRNGCEEFPLKLWNGISYLTIRRNSHLQKAPNYNWAYVERSKEFYQKLNVQLFQEKSANKNHTI